MGSPALVTSQLPPENTKVLAFGNCYRPLDMLQSVINTLRALILPFNLHIFPYDTFLLSRSCCTVVRYIEEASYSLTRMPLHFNMSEKESNPILGVFPKVYSASIVQQQQQEENSVVPTIYIIQ